MSLFHLSVADGSHHLAVLLDLVEVLVDGQGSTSVVLPEVSTLLESLLLGAIPWGGRESRGGGREDGSPRQ